LARELKTEYFKQQNHLPTEPISPPIETNPWTLDSGFNGNLPK